MRSSRHSQGIRILLSEGSSLSARETISVLGPLGYRLSVLDPNPLCLARFSRFVGSVYRCPPPGKDPFGYLSFALDIMLKQHFDVLLPVHEQAFLFAHARNRLPDDVGTALADFAAFRQLQSKSAFSRLLTELNLPQPSTRFAGSQDALIAAIDHVPVYVKAAYGTAGQGVWRVDDWADRTRVIVDLERGGYLNGRTELVVQDAIGGVLCQAQAVFEQGHLVAVHCTSQRAEGMGGSQSARVGVDHPAVREHLQRVGDRLAWHGALALDYLYDPTSNQPTYIEANPRLVEPFNAAASGVNLADVMVRLSRGESFTGRPMLVGRAGVRTHGLLPTLLGIADRGGGRRAILRVLIDAAVRREPFRSSSEGVTPVVHDLPSLVPLGVVAMQLLSNPRAGFRIARRAVGDYALTRDAIEAILAS